MHGFDTYQMINDGGGEFCESFCLLQEMTLQKGESRWWVPAFVLIDVVRHLYCDLREEQSLSLHFADFTKRP